MPAGLIMAVQVYLGANGQDIIPRIAGSHFGRNGQGVVHGGITVPDNAKGKKKQCRRRHYENDQRDPAGQRVDGE